MATCCGLRQPSLLPSSKPVKVLAYSSLHPLGPNSLSFHNPFTFILFPLHGDDLTDNMDVTAFETEEADCLTWDEVIELVPQSIQAPVSAV